MSHAVAAETGAVLRRSKDDLTTMFPALKATFNDTPAPVWVTNLEGQHLYTNPAGAEVLGGGVGHGTLRDQRSVFGEMLDEVSRLHRPVQRSARLRGRQFDALLSPLQNHHGRTVAALMTLRPAD